MKIYLKNIEIIYILIYSFLILYFITDITLRNCVFINATKLQMNNYENNIENNILIQNSKFYGKNHIYLHCSSETINILLTKNLFKDVNIFSPQLFFSSFFF